MTARRPRSTAGDFTFAAATAPHRAPEPAGEPGPAGPAVAEAQAIAPDVAPPVQQARPVPPVVSESPEPASELASSLAASPKADTPSAGRAGMNIPLSALMSAQLDPEMDLVPTGVRVPRYVSEALRLTALLSRREQQRIVAEALIAYLPQELLDETYRNAAGGADRPSG